LFESYNAAESRVFEIGGSPHSPTTGGTNVPPGLVLNDILEFSHAAMTGGGGSIDKSGGAGGGSFGRMFSNAVALPDETIFLVGGSKKDLCQ
jgi:hypothetical protein